ncbi:hypothetical protein LCGC14_0346060 [marine sediment metagenome]|uniref:Uncharacterized protein n=1 Tax=marine sediment metagenome TaxID=412755 RepID=A0A0F9THX2_9ZZZZ
MSTRSQIVIKGCFDDEIVFYRHCDGYPEVSMAPLQKLMDWMRRGIIRDNAEQAAGWLILIGAIEYATIPEYELEPNDKAWKRYGLIETIKDPTDWKCGAYEPATCRHGDIEFLYILDLKEKTISCYTTHFDGVGFPDKEKDKLQFVDTAENPWKGKS